MWILLCLVVVLPGASRAERLWRMMDEAVDSIGASAVAPGVALMMTNQGLCLSRDEGETWFLVDVPVLDGIGGVVDIIWDGKLFWLATGTRLLSSPDGEVWTLVKEFGDGFEEGAIIALKLADGKAVALVGYFTVETLYYQGLYLLRHNPVAQIWEREDIPALQGYIEDFASHDGVTLLVGYSTSFQNNSHLPLLYRRTGQGAWAKVDDFPGAEGKLTSVIFHNGHWIVAGDQNRTYRSSNGLTWQTGPADQFKNPEGTILKVLGSRLFALDVRLSASRLTESEDGLTWTNRRREEQVSTFSGLAWTGRYFITVDFDRLIRSEDARLWKSDSGASVSNVGGRAIAQNGAITYMEAGGSEMVLNRSNALEEWSSLIHMEPEPYYITALAYGNGRLVAIGDDGRVHVSLNEGLTWQQSTLPGDFVINRVIWDGSRFVAVGYDSCVLTSSDGLAWTVKLDYQFGNLSDVAASPSTLVAVGHAIFSGPRNGDLEWRQKPEGTGTLNHVVWTGDAFVAAGSGGSIIHSVPTPDGLAWAKASGSGSSDIRGLVWAGSRAYALAANGNLLQSTDGKTWSEVAIEGLIRPERFLFWTGEWLLANHGSEGLVKSRDGTVWELIPNPNQRRFSHQNTQAMTRGDGRYVMVGGNHVTYSDDGENWHTAFIPPSISLNDVIWDGDRFMAVGFWQLSSNEIDAVVLTSANGEAWDITNVVTPANRLIRIHQASNGYFTLAQNSGQDAFSGSVILHSTDGTDWTLVYEYEGDQLGAITSMGSRIFAAGTMYEIIISEDNGETWTIHEIEPWIINDFMVVGSELYAGGPGLLAKSANGIHWVNLDWDFTDGEIDRMVPGPEGAFAVGRYGLYLSNNRQHWTFRGIDSYQSYAVAYWDDDGLLLADHKGGVLKSIPSTLPAPIITKQPGSVTWDDNADTYTFSMETSTTGTPNISWLFSPDGGLSWHTWDTSFSEVNLDRSSLTLTDTQFLSSLYQFRAAVATPEGVVFSRPARFLAEWEVDTDPAVDFWQDDFYVFPGSEPGTDQWYFSFTFKSIFHFAGTSWFYFEEWNTYAWVDIDSGALGQGFWFYMITDDHASWVYTSRDGNFHDLRDSNRDGIPDLDDALAGAQPMQGYMFFETPMPGDPAGSAWYFYGDYTDGNWIINLTIANPQSSDWHLLKAK